MKEGPVLYFNKNCFINCLFSVIKHVRKNDACVKSLNKFHFSELTCCKTKYYSCNTARVPEHNPRSKLQCKQVEKNVEVLF